MQLAHLVPPADTLQHAFRLEGSAFGRIKSIKPIYHSIINCKDNVKAGKLYAVS